MALCGDGSKICRHWSIKKPTETDVSIHNYSIFQDGVCGVCISAAHFYGLVVSQIGMGFRKPSVGEPNTIFYVYDNVILAGVITVSLSLY